jgi:hypothetical protein
MTTAEEAIQLVESEAFDLVITAESETAYTSATCQQLRRHFR